MRSINIAIVSDLHIGSKARANDLCPEMNAEAVDTDYRRRFAQFVRRVKLTANYLVIPGDVSDCAKPNEFTLASEVVGQIAPSLGVRLKHVLFIPGNHDVDWSVMRADPTDRTGVRRQQRYDPLRQSTKLFRRILRQGRPSLLEEPYFTVWEFSDLVAVGYNSAWHDDPAKSNHYGLIHNDAIAALEECFAGLDLSPSRVRMFIVHHHPVQYSDPVPDDPDFSIMVNAGGLVDLLHKHHFDLMVHGHKHAPNFRIHRTNARHPLVIVGSGSFSARLDTRWSGHVSNQFHVLYVAGRDADSECIFGTFESWAYLCGRGWGPSQPSNGIRHKLPYGTYIGEPELKKALRPVIGERLKRRDYVEWSAIVAELPSLQHLPPDTLTDVLDGLGSELRFRRHGQPPDDFILLRLEVRNA